MNRYNFISIKTLILLTAVCFTLTSAFAQNTNRYSRTVRLDFPRMPSEKVSLGLNNGSTIDVIYSGYTDAGGKLSITMDEQWKEYAGIACLWIAEEAICFILSDEYLVLYSTAETVNANNVIYGNSVENVLLQSMLKEQKTWLNDSQAGLRMYALEYMFLLDLNKQLPALKDADTSQKQIISDNLFHRMDMDVLYTSGLWKQVLNCITQIYRGDDSLQKAFRGDMQSLGKRIASPAAYRAFTDFLDACLRENQIQEKGLKNLVDTMKKDRRYGRKDRAELFTGSAEHDLSNRL